MTGWVKRGMLRAIEATLGPLIDRRVQHNRLRVLAIHGDSSRVKIHPTAVVNNALINTVSGRVEVRDHAFFGHNVSLLTGTHDVHAFGEARKWASPSEGRDIVVESGAWLASNATVLGPCVIGANAVVAAGAVVNKDVPPYAIVGGVPAKILGWTDASTDRADVAPLASPAND